MADLYIRTPRSLGAARLQILRPNGETVSGLNTPQDDVMLVSDATFGDYLAMIQPIGGARQSVSFSFQAGDSEILLNPTSTSAITASTMEGGEPGGLSAARPEAMAFTSGTPSSAAPMLKLINDQPLDPFFFLGADYQQDRSQGNDPQAVNSTEVPDGPPKQDFVSPSVTGPPTSNKSRSRREEPERLSIGISQDALPFDPGGWRPYHDRWPTIEHNAEAVTLTFGRGSGALPEPQFARLRLSATLTGGANCRLLVPLFDGGSRIILKPRRDHSGEIDIALAPLDADRLALTQALASGFGDEGNTILAQFTASNDLASYIGDDAPADPWTAILGLLVGTRFAKLQDEGDALVDQIARTYGWITDALILQARRYVMLSEREPARFDDHRQQALRVIKRARRVGAPYFFYSKTIASDVLAALTSRPGAEDQQSATDDFTRESEREHAKWQAFIRWQGQAGAFFTWQSHRRYSHATGFDPRYTATIADDLLMS